MCRVVFVVGLVTWLAYRLSDIGWLEVWISRPQTPWFYVTWLGLYLQLPVIESLIFQAAWKLPPSMSLLPLLHKRTLNQDVLSGMGEAWFFIWARQRVTLPDREIAGTLKDNLMLLSLAAWLSIVLLVVLAEPILWTRLIADTDLRVMVLAGVAIVLFVALAVRFRHTLLTLTPRADVALFALHLGRFVLLVYVLQIVQWWVVLPEAPFSLWATILAMIMVVNRIPFIPARDLVGVGAVLAVMALPARYEATIVAMLLVRTVLDRIFNAAAVVARLMLRRR